MTFLWPALRLAVVSVNWRCCRAFKFSKQIAAFLRRFPCKRSGGEINNETWTEFRLPEQTTFGTCTSGYKVVGGTNDEVSTLTDEKTVSESLRDLCRQASLTGVEREAMMTMVGEAWDHGKLISSALQF